MVVDIYITGLALFAVIAVSTLSLWEVLDGITKRLLRIERLLRSARRHQDIEARDGFMEVDKDQPRWTPKPK